jgi:hypothetical protein
MVFRGANSSILQVSPFNKLKAQPGGGARFTVN